MEAGCPGIGRPAFFFVFADVSIVAVVRTHRVDVKPMRRVVIGMIRERSLIRIPVALVEEDTVRHSDGCVDEHRRAWASPLHT